MRARPGWVVVQDRQLHRETNEGGRQKIDRNFIPRWEEFALRTTLRSSERFSRSQQQHDPRFQTRGLDLRQDERLSPLASPGTAFLSGQPLISSLCIGS
ncbi:UNVERIFIED_CONTAM: hypothetical protein K2H54_041184 [Gekko kuhli]